ncbi:hypothetical protein FRC06_005150, partial [Ceratobasidium sp. 370]
MVAAQNTTQGTNTATREEADFHPRSSTLGHSSDLADTADEGECGRSPQHPSLGPSNAATQSTNMNRSRSKTKSPARHHSPSSPLPPSTPPVVQSGQDNQAGGCYENCLTSYEKQPGKRGGRITRVANGKEEIVYIDVEKLGTWEAKYEYFKTHCHPFGIKHNTYFNPYSTTTSNLKNYKQITWPSGIQFGRGDATPMHEIMGCRPDYEFYTIFSGNLLKWTQYGKTARLRVYQAILKKYPFCHHFCDETNEDNWVINPMAISYLSHTRAYTTEKKRTRYLRRHSLRFGQDKEDANGEEEEEIDDEGEEPDEDAAPGDVKDDYAANAPAHGTAPCSSTGHNRNKPAHTTAPSSSRSAQPSTASHGLALPTQTSNRDNRCADKVTAVEERLSSVQDHQTHKHLPAQEEREASIPIGSDTMINITSSSAAASSDAPDVPATTVPSTSSK